MRFFLVHYFAARFLAVVPGCGRLAVRVFLLAFRLAANSRLARNRVVSRASGITKEILPCLFCYKAPPKRVQLLPSGITTSGNHRLV